VTAPAVSIGLPVYNGERYVAGAIESVLHQTWTDWELIVCDNASTDATEEIARRYASTDPRIRYVRNDENVGAAENFNRVFELGRGTFFQWLAHDDELQPEFIEACHEALQVHQTAVLAFPWVVVIDESGQQIGSWELTFAVDSPQPQERFRDILLEWHNSFFVFGLIRAEHLRRSRLIEPFAHGDTILLARLSLLGPFVQIPRHLFRSRKHAKQSNEIFIDHAVPRGLDLVAYSDWFRPPSGSPIDYPYTRVLRAYSSALHDIDLKVIDRVACYGALAHLAVRYRRGLAGDVRTAVGAARRRILSSTDREM
jgi:glycosyltransferase involved in cell wall biosynthesis